MSQWIEQVKAYDNSVALSCQGNTPPTTTTVRFTTQSIGAVTINS